MVRGWATWAGWMFWAPALAGEPRWVRAEPAMTGGTVDVAAFLDTLDASAGLLLQCYERELRLRPDLTAKVLLKVVVAPDGRVVSAGGSGLGGAADLCLPSALRRIRFPPTPAGAQVTVVVPSVFTTAEGPVVVDAKKKAR
ncbi:MAG: hypothetical protein RLZZ383_2069 [Pseudomonadota bacterium]|jgi:hypothetical protein